MSKPAASGSRRTQRPHWLVGLAAALFLLVFLGAATMTSRAPESKPGQR